ncbi:ABC-three component system protein [Comamonas thiooxydans]|uniref:ABC-three component system protein n=1 Tax=Comamonas thiooxydans TaxID=363952 RepID=UPI002114A2F1|nr:ABC-three component system protein [Comamonas thiooxydans]UUE95079.1 hypothetical protein MJ608_05360 [Comamonas thiooxydans]
MTTELPKSAISSWGGFVYQGKVALYHAISLLLDKSFNGRNVEQFTLQLDSTDDFAIYIDSNAISVHQVKAKIAVHRSAFIDALDKSSLIYIDCTPETVRYFHIAQPLNDASNYINPAGGLVAFYEYDESKKYCPIGDIENLSKSKIREYLKKNELAATEILIDKKYCRLSELISSQVIKIHAAIHSGQREDAAAYSLTLSSSEIRLLLEKEYRDAEDEEYILFKLRSDFADTLEQYVLDVDNFSEEEILRAQKAFHFLYSLEDRQLRKVLTSLRPHGRDEVLSLEDYQNYADIVMTIVCEMILYEVPHYGKGTLKYLPTGIRLEERRASLFRKKLLKQIQENPHLVNLLFEFDNFIALGDFSDLVVEEGKEKITCTGFDDMQRFNIVKVIEMRIISRDIAQKELNDQ